MTPDELRQWRRTNAVTQAELAEILGVTPRAVSYWEAGQRRIPEWVPRLARLTLQEQERELAQ